MSSPPHYVLLSHSVLSSSCGTTITPAPILVHPTIQYQYRDDPPLSLANSQNVLVMDFDPTSPDNPLVQSLSSQLAVTSIKVTDAPGTGADEGPKNTRMYVLETVAHQASDESSEKCRNADDAPSVVSVTSFKQRNGLLRRALEYPLPSTSLPTPMSAAIAPTASSRPSPCKATASLPPATPAS